jgi:protein CpxP
MKTPFRTLVSVAALGAAICVSSASFAQAPPPPGAMPGAMMAPSDAQHDHWADRMHEQAEAKARALHDILNIRPDQDAAFQAMFATMMPPEGGHGMGMHDDQDHMDRMTTPERLDRMAAHMAERQAQFQRHADAVKQLYAVLGPDQRRAFDALTGMMMMMGDHHHGMGGMAMGDHHGGDDD